MKVEESGPRSSRLIRRSCSATSGGAAVLDGLANLAGDGRAKLGVLGVGDDVGVEVGVAVGGHQARTPVSTTKAVGCASWTSARR